MNDMLEVLNDVNIIDLIIMAQAKEVGVLLTEDRVSTDMVKRLV